MNRRLYRSTADRVIAGVCGGLADLWGIDPSLLRIGWFVLILVTGGIFFLIYIVMAIVVPAGAPSPADRWRSAAPDAPRAWGTDWDASWDATPAGAAAFAEAPTEGAAEPWASPPLAAPVASPPPAPGTPPPPAWTAPPPAPAAWSHEHRGPGSGAIVFGLILVIVGAAFLINQFVPAIDMGVLWPAAAIVLGAVLLVAAFIPVGRH